MSNEQPPGNYNWMINFNFTGTWLVAKIHDIRKIAFHCIVVNVIKDVRLSFVNRL